MTFILTYFGTLKQFFWKNLWFFLFTICFGTMLGLERRTSCSPKTRFNPLSHSAYMKFSFHTASSSLLYQQYKTIKFKYTIRYLRHWQELNGTTVKRFFSNYFRFFIFQGFYLSLPGIVFFSSLVFLTAGAWTQDFVFTKHALQPTKPQRLHEVSFSHCIKFSSRPKVQNLKIQIHDPILEALAGVERHHCGTLLLKLF